RSAALTPLPLSPTPPPPRPTLFPYTTLFRSRRLAQRPFRRPRELRAAGRHPPVLDRPQEHALLRVRGRAALGAGRAGGGAARQRDRKSTRLNSSHGSISYAVFCLKKKIHYSQ